MNETSTTQNYLEYISVIKMMEFTANSELEILIKDDSGKVISNLSHTLWLRKMCAIDYLNANTEKQKEVFMENFLLYNDLIKKVLGL